MKTKRKKERCGEEGKNKREEGKTKKNKRVNKTEGASEEVGVQDFKNQTINNG